MNWQKMLQELPYCALKVVIYCMNNKSVKEWNSRDFGKWLGLKRNTATMAWKEGISALCRLGYLELVGYNNSIMKFTLKIKGLD